MKKKIIILCLAVVIVGISIAVYSILQKNNTCLKDNELTSYENDKDTTYIIMSDKKTRQEINRFQIQNTIDNHYHGQELHKCNFYVIRQFNYDSKTRRKTPNYRIELWSYNYNYAKNGRSILVFSKTDNNGNYLLSFNDDFRISPNEKYLVLEKGYLGQDDYSLVIKDLKTIGDLFVLKYQDIIKEHPKMLGSLGMLKWTDENRYFWAEVFDGAYTKGFVRIDSQNWSYEIFELPNDMDIGVSGPLNFNTGYTILYPGLVWTGVVEVDEQIKEQWRKEGQQSKMYLYNIFSKEKTFLATTSEPLWDFNAQWLSDNELQYEMPGGEKKIYEIK